MTATGVLSVIVTFLQMYRHRFECRCMAALIYSLWYQHIGFREISHQVACTDCEGLNFELAHPSCVIKQIDQIIGLQRFPCMSAGFISSI